MNLLFPGFTEAATMFVSPPRILASYCAVKGEVRVLLLLLRLKVRGLPTEIARKGEHIVLIISRALLEELDTERPHERLKSST